MCGPRPGDVVQTARGTPPTRSPTCTPGASITSPTTDDVTHYMVSLHWELPSPASVTNILSGACAWRREVGTSDATFTIPLADLVKRGVHSRSRLAPPSQ